MVNKWLALSTEKKIIRDKVQTVDLGFYLFLFSFSFFTFTLNPFLPCLKSPYLDFIKFLDKLHFFTLILARSHLLHSAHIIRIYFILMESFILLSYHYLFILIYY